MECEGKKGSNYSLLEKISVMRYSHQVEISEDPLKISLNQWHLNMDDLHFEERENTV